MARLNAHLSATPQPRNLRASTTDSLYRDPSVAPRTSTAYSAMSPEQSVTSNKENETPGGHSHSSKRRRTGAHSMAVQDPEDDDDDDDDDGGGGGGDNNSDDDQQETPPAVADEEEGDSKFYNPNQDPEERRHLRANMRDHQRMVEENRDELIKDNHSLEAAITKADNFFGKVRQTADATVDSRFLVFTSDIAVKKMNNSLNSTAGVGIDYDQFVSKCIYYMKSGGHRTDVAVADDEEDDEGDGLDWALLGREACFPSNTRPPVSSFLLGPLSVQRRVRATQVRARFQRQPVGPATRPQEVNEADMTQSESSNLSQLVKGIKTRLEDHIKRGTDGVDSELSEIAENDLDDEDHAAAFRRYRVAPTPDGEAAVGLLDFAINPHDFGQTIENLFYISFLVREGNAQVVKDDDGLPLLVPAVPRSVSDQQVEGAHKHQAVFSIDYPTWRMFITAFDIREPLIPHREVVEDVVAPGGWYS